MANNNGRIEISLDEYNSLRDNIDVLNKTIAGLNKKVEVYEDKIGRLADTFVDLYGSTIQARIFRWGHICNPMFEEFNRQ